jgi:hypothetical protein
MEITYLLMNDRATADNWNQRLPLFHFARRGVSVYFFQMSNIVAFLVHLM